jgi:hypothetical protein
MREEAIEWATRERYGGRSEGEGRVVLVCSAKF